MVIINEFIIEREEKKEGGKDNNNKKSSYFNFRIAMSHFLIIYINLRIMHQHN